jgi:hypothetical protein
MAGELDGHGDARTLDARQRAETEGPRRDDGPVLPMLTAAPACACFSAAIIEAIDESGFERSAVAGDSPIPITWVA